MFRTTSNIKQAIIDKITATDNEQILERIKADVDYLTAGNHTTEILHELSPKDKAELMALANEPDDFETISYEALKQSISRWLTK